MKISGIKETCIYVSDLLRTKNFYGEALGLPVISIVEDRHIFFVPAIRYCFVLLPKKLWKKKSCHHTALRAVFILRLKWKRQNIPPH